MYSPPCTAPGNNGEQSFVAGANPLALLDHAMDFDEHTLYPMHNVGMQDGVQFYNPTTGIFLPSSPLLTNNNCLFISQVSFLLLTFTCFQLSPGAELSRNMSMEKGLKGGKRKGSGEGSSSMHSQVMKLQIFSPWVYFQHSGLCLIVYVSSQEEIGATSQREVNMDRASEKAGDADSNREDYVHIRAKRGQATNNHSLAERVMNLSSNIIIKHCCT
jgi:hypothetical protein